MLFGLVAEMNISRAVAVSLQKTPFVLTCKNDLNLISYNIESRLGILYHHGINNLTQCWNWLFHILSSEKWDVGRWRLFEYC